MAMGGGIRRNSGTELKLYLGCTGSTSLLCSFGKLAIYGILAPLLGWRDGSELVCSMYPVILKHNMISLSDLDKEKFLTVMFQELN